MMLLVEIASKTAVWYSTGLPAVPVRWVLIRDPEGGFETQALLCTELDTDPRQIVSWFVMRWQLEVTSSNLRRCACVSAKGAVGRCDFSRVARAERSATRREWLKSTAC
jgi:hypothetical protein